MHAFDKQLQPRTGVASKILRRQKIPVDLKNLLPLHLITQPPTQNHLKSQQNHLKPPQNHLKPQQKHHKSFPKACQKLPNVQARVLQWERPDPSQGCGVHWSSKRAWLCSVALVIVTLLIIFIITIILILFITLTIIISPFLLGDTRQPTTTPTTTASSPTTTSEERLLKKVDATTLQLEQPGGREERQKLQHLSIYRQQQL